MVSPHSHSSLLTASPHMHAIALDCKSSHALSLDRMSSSHVRPRPRSHYLDLVLNHNRMTANVTSIRSTVTLSALIPTKTLTGHHLEAQTNQLRRRTALDCHTAHITTSSTQFCSNSMPVPVRSPFS